jgi:HK97 family phage major capsid protein
MSLRKQIDALTKKRNAHLDAMAAISDLAGNEERLFTEAEQKAYDKDQGEVRDIDAQLQRLLEAERQTAARATPAPSPLAPYVEPTIKFVPFKGQAFTRYVSALARSKGNLMLAVELAKTWDNETPEVGAVLRAAVAAGTTTDPVWAAPLVNYQLMVNEFIELLRAETVMGRLSGYRSVPFNIKIPRQTAGVTAGWVGEGASKPVSKLAFDSITLPWSKMAVIVVITQELARFSNPSAERLVRDDLVAAVAEFMDLQLLDDAVTASAGIRPASITNAATKIPSTGGTVGAITADLSKAILNITNPPNNIPLRKPVWLMGYGAATYLAYLRTAQDIFAFPSMSAGGAPGTVGSSPTLMGIPVIVSGNIKSGVIILLEQSELMIADDGQTMIDTSAEASLQMDSAPATPPAPLVSLWQQNMLGIKAERYAHWLMRRTAAVQEITGASVPAGTAVAEAA